MERMPPLPTEYWGLNRWPFHAKQAINQFYPTAGSTEALARIGYLAEGRRVGVLIGESGVGKSLLLHQAARQLSRQGRVVVLIDAFGVTPRELLWQVAVKLGTAPAEDMELPKLWRLITDRIAENRLQQLHTVLLIDDVGQAGPDLITTITRLARLEPLSSPSRTIVLAAEAPQALRWNEALRGQVDLWIDLRLWELDETVGFVQTALVDAGRIEPLFEDSALQALHELSRGVPRHIIRIAEAALLAGATAGRQRIDAECLRSAQDETFWPASIVAG